MSLYQRGFKMSFNKQLAGSLGALLLLSCSGAVAEMFQGRPGEDTIKIQIELDPQAFQIESPTLVSNTVKDDCGTEERTNRSITRADALHRLFKEFDINTKGASFPSPLPFDDVKDSDSDIAYAYNAGIISGTDNSRYFNPNCYVARIEFVKMVLQTAGISLDRALYSNKPVFGDIPDSSSYWYDNYLWAAYNLGIIQGTDEDPKRLMPALALSETEYNLIIQRTKACCNRTVYSWNGNGSVISYNFEEGFVDSELVSSYGVAQDQVIISSDSPNKPVVFFQWQRYFKKGKSLRIEANDTSTPTATIVYGVWDTPANKKIAYRKVSLPFVLDPTKDGLAGDDGQWFTIAVAFDERLTTNNSPTTITATPTDTVCNGGLIYGCYKESEQFSAGLSVDGFMWTGVGSLMTHGAGKSDSITQDVVNIDPHVDKPTVAFFQWNLTKSKHLRFRTEVVPSPDSMPAPASSSCDYNAKITYGLWDTRDNDVSFFAPLNSTPQFLISSTLNKLRDGSLLYGNNSLVSNDWITVKIEFASNTPITNGICRLHIGTENAAGPNWQ